MPVTLRKLSKKIFIMLNLVLTAATLAACLVTWLPAGKYWWAAILGLGFPMLLGGQLLFLVFWLLFRSKWSLLPLISLLLSFQQIHAFFAFNFSRSWKNERSDSTLRVMSWNVSRWDEFSERSKVTNSYKPKMLDLIEEHKADVLCFQEFFESSGSKKITPTLIEFTKRMGYKYHYFSVEVAWNNKGKHESGIIILSRYPILDSNRIRFGGNSSAESIISCDIAVKGKVIRFVTTHLQSVRFKESDYKNIDKIKKNNEGLEASKPILQKLKRAYYFRSQQADVVRRVLDESPHPLVFTGDFNDVPNSYTYFRIKGDRQDAFTEKGSGIGRSFRRIFPTLRIDYIFADKSFKIEQFKRMQVPYSDHYPLIADLTLP